MKLFKGFALLGALLVLAGCSASGNGGSTGGGGGGSGNGGDSDAFLTAIGKYSKLVGELSNPNEEIIVSTDGKVLTEKSTGDDYKYTFIRSLSATTAEYKEDERVSSMDPSITTATFEIIGDKVEMVSFLFGSGENGNKVTLTPVPR